MKTRVAILSPLAIFSRPLVDYLEKQRSYQKYNIYQQARILRQQPEWQWLREKVDAGQVFSSEELRKVWQQTFPFGYERVFTVEFNSIHKLVLYQGQVKSNERFVIIAFDISFREITTAEIAYYQRALSTEKKNLEKDINLFKEFLAELYEDVRFNNRIIKVDERLSSRKAVEQFVDENEL